MGEDKIPISNFFKAHKTPPLLQSSHFSNIRDSKTRDFRFYSSNIRDSKIQGFRSYSSKRLTNVEQNSFSITPNLNEIIIGLTLGDLSISKRYTNAILHFKQGLVNKEYIYHLFKLFSNYSNFEATKHHEIFDKRYNKTYTSIIFNSYSLPCFNYYYDLFYVNGVKTIPLNIGDLLTLLVWYIGLWTTVLN